jgi:predicted RecA/RadA family phage recombinase
VADIAVRTYANSGDPAISVEESTIQDTQIAGEAITAGQPVVHASASGNFIKAGTGVQSAAVYGVATRSVAAGEAVTAIRKGVLDGYNLDSYNFSALMYTSATAGAIADATSASAVVLGRVIPGRSNLRGNLPDRLLFVDL